MLLRCLGVVALAVTGCTLDYDALITGAGGGGGATSAADTTTDGSTTTAGTTTTTTSTSTSSGGGGQGGEGQGTGAQGGGGGAGGSGGQGGELPFSAPCPGLALTWTDDLSDSLGDEWEEAGGNDVTPTPDPVEGLIISLEGEPGDDERAVIQTASDEAIDGCSVTVPVTTLDPDEPEEAYLQAGLAAGDRGIQIVVARGDAGVTCTVRSGDLDGESATEVPCSGGAPERLLRVRHTGDGVCFDMAVGGDPFAQVGPCHPVDGGRRVFFGAAAETTARAVFGDVR